MNLKMLQQLESILQPQNIYPIHIDDYSHYQTTKTEVEASNYTVLSVGETISI